MSARFRPACETLDARITPSGNYDPRYFSPKLDALVAEARFVSPSVTSADLTGDGNPEVVISGGKGDGPRLIVVDGTPGTTAERDPTPVVLFNGFAKAFDPSFTGGVRVTGFLDVYQAGRSKPKDFVTITAMEGGGPVLDKLEFDPARREFSEVARLVFDDANFRGGVYVDADDIDGDGNPEIRATAGTGGGPRVQWLDQATFAVKQDTVIGGPDTAFRQTAELHYDIAPAGVIPSAGAYGFKVALVDLVGADGTRTPAGAVRLDTGEFVIISNGPPAAA